MPAVAPAFLRAQDKAGTKAPILGQGAHTYEAIHDWGELPASIKWGNTHGVVEDSQGNIYVHHTVYKDSESADTMVVFDAKGKFVRSWGKEFRGVAHGLHIRKEGTNEFLYLTVNAGNARMTPQPEMQAIVLKTTLKGEIVWKIQGPPPDIDAYKPGADGKAKAYNPTNIAIAPNGDFYVGDGYGSSHMLRFSASGKFIGEIGTPGHGDGQLDNPHGQWVDLRGHDPVLAVADRGNRRIQTFTLDGKHLATIKDESHLRMPCHFHTQGDSMVCPDLDSQVCILDRNYKVVAQLGDGQASNGPVGSRRGQLRSQFTPGQFIAPHDAIFLKTGDILVAEWLPIGRITLLRRV